MGTSGVVAIIYASATATNTVKIRQELADNMDNHAVENSSPVTDNTVYTYAYG